MANLSISPGEPSPVDINQFHELGAEKVWLPYAHVAQLGGPDVLKIFTRADGRHAGRRARYRGRKSRDLRSNDAQ